MTVSAIQDGAQTDEVALHLIALLFRAVVDRSGWKRFAAALSDATGGAAVTLAIRQPDTRLGWDYFGAGAHDVAIRVAEDLQGALVVAARRVEGYRHGFVDLGEAFPGIRLESDPWFQEWLDPAGIAPTWPLCHAVTVGRTICCWILAHPPADGEIDGKRLAELEPVLVPQLARAFAIHRDLRERDHKQRALEEILDRLPTGVVLVEAGRRVIHANLSAQRMIALDDGLAIRDGWLVAGPETDASLQAAIDAAIEAAARGAFDHVGRIQVPTHSGRRPFLLALMPLLPRVAGSPVHDAVAMAFIASPDAISTASAQALGAVYGLTEAEAVVVRGLVQGRCLEEIAAERGVKPETARSQLKQVFAKTRTSRQAELIRLVLTGVSPLSQSASPPRSPAGPDGEASR